MGDTNLKTITFDPAVYKVVPVSLSDDMRMSIEGVNNSMEIAEYEAMHKCMLAAVPDQLPGVVEHSGEPIGYFNVKHNSFFPLAQLASTERNEKLMESGEIIRAYTHPAPSQPSTAKYTPPTETECDEFRRTPGSFNVMVRAIHEHGYHTYAGAANVHFGEFYKAKFDAAIASQPSAEAIVQAALESAIDALYKVSCECAARHAAIEEAATAIRAIDKQQIIESVKS